MKRKYIPLIALLAAILAAPLPSRAAGADTLTSATPPKTNTKVQTVPRAFAFPTDKPYTLQEMLTYAIKAEYAAQTLYTNALVIDTQAEPFGCLLQEENSMIDQLTVLLKDNGLALPDPAAVPEKAVTSLKGACLAGIEAERTSIEMYQAFLSKDSLPSSVRQVFQLSLDAARSRLDTLMTTAGGEGWLQAAQNEGDRDDDGSAHEDDDDEYEDDDEDDESDDDEDDEDSDDDDDGSESAGPDDGDDD